MRTYMETKETIIFIIGIAGILLNFLIFQQKTSKRLLLCKLISNVTWALFYFVSEAYTGFAVACIAIAREITFISVPKKSKLGIACLSIFVVTAIVCSIFTWKSPISILPAIASITSVFGFYFSIPKLSRILVFPISLCMGIYDIQEAVWMGLANECITIISAIWGLIIMDMLKKQNKQNVRVGVVQWDCSMPSNTWWGQYQTRTLSPKKFRTATPFYADILGEDKIDYHWRTQEEFDVELQYAIDAGIDYFAYVFYPDEGSKAHVPTGPSDCSHQVYNLKYAYRMYLSSELKNKIGFAAIMGKHPFATSDYLELAELMKQPFYEKYEGHPIVYLFWQIKEADIEGVLKAVEQVGGEKPLFIAMFGGKPPMDTRYDLVEGLSAYSCGIDGITTHAELVDRAIEENIWRATARENDVIDAKNINKTVPLYPVGWDPSPRVDIPSPWTTYPDGPYAAQPTEQDLIEGSKTFADAIKNTECLADTFFGHIMMFAWNEFEEGGWICPTYNEDLTINTEKVYAVAKVIDYWKKTL